MHLLNHPNTQRTPTLHKIEYVFNGRLVGLDVERDLISVPVGFALRDQAGVDPRSRV
ncbi:MAG: hypothetical protein K7J46_03305 [Bryobacter sp.]|nr:hypothetical protein [Bryobacter sp. CoA8 C33]